LYPVPGEQALAVQVATLKGLFPDDYRRAEDPSPSRAKIYQHSLARKLMRTAGDTPPQSDGYYAMLRESIRLAVLCGKIALAFESIETLAQSHAVDVVELKIDALTQFSVRDARLTDVRAAANVILPAAQAAADSQRLGLTASVLAVGEEISGRLQESTLRNDLHEARRVLELLQQQELKFVAASNIVENDPDDPLANEVLAVFFGLRRGQWETAELYAARIENDEIRSLIVREFDQPEETLDVLQLANDWWKFAEKQDGAVKLQAMELAADHYQEIVDDLTGLNSRLVESRLKAVDRTNVLSVRAATLEKPDVEGVFDVPADIVGVLPPAQRLGDPPPLAVAPFNAGDAIRFQKMWCAHLDLPLRYTNEIGMVFVLIPPGEFMMGAAADDRDASDTDKPRHPVRISKPFYMQKTLVTQTQYESLAGVNRSAVRGANNPVTVISWDDAQAFINALNTASGSQDAYRLPTDAEWEFSCRAGTTTKYFFGDVESEGRDFIAAQTPRRPVQSAKPNPWELHDLYGIWQWPLDAKRSYSSSRLPLTDPTGPLDRSPRGIRGQLKSAGRGANLPQHGGRVGPAPDLGIRLVREIPGLSP